MSRTMLLLKHVHNGNVERVKDLLEAGSNINVVGPKGLSPLHVACFNGNFQIAKMLIEAGAEVNARCKYGLLPLHYACGKGCIDIVSLLLDSGAGISCSGAHGFTPLITASNQGHKELVELLLNRGAEANECCRDKTNSLHFACRTGYVGIATLLLKSGVKVNEKDGKGMTPLSTAVVNEHKELVAMLLKEGADLNEKSNTGRTPLRHDPNRTRDRWSYLFGMDMDEMIYQMTFEKLELKEEDSKGLTPLSTAVCTGNYEIVRLLVESGARLDDKDASLTPLHYACMKGYTGITTYLLESGANVSEVTGHYTETPLHHACSRGMLEIVKILVQYKADLEAKTSDGLTPYTCAGRRQHSTILEVLIDAGAKVDREVHTSELLHTACKEGDVGKVKKLWSLGADIDASENSDSYHSKNPNPLHYTGKSNRWEMMKILLELGADVNKKGYNGETPLHRHCAAGSADTVKLLLQSGAKVELNGNYGDSPLHMVNGPEGDEIVKLLLSSGISVDQENHKGETPLHKLCQRGNVQAVVSLLAAGASVHEKDRNRNTPLHHAYNWSQTSRITDAAGVQKQVEIIIILLKLGASVNAHNRDNRAPMDLACDQSHACMIEVLLQSGVNVNSVLDGSKLTPLHHVIEKSYVDQSSRLARMKVLLKYGADVEEANGEGSRPIHILGSQGDVEALEILLQHGADIDGTDGDGKTSLHHACEEGNMEVVKLLLECGAKPNIPDKNGMSSLHYARLNLCGGEELVKTLLKNGADVNFQDTLGNSALHYVTYEDREYYYDSDDDFPYELGGHHEQIGVLKMLVEGGANVNLNNEKGEVPLQVHIKHEDNSYDLDSPRLFLEAGTDLSALNIHGEFLNSLVSQYRVTLLLDYGVGDLTCRCKSCPDDTPVLMCAFNQLECSTYVCHTIKVEVAELNTPKVQLLNPKHRMANSTFRESCEKEVDLMKHECIGDSNFTYYDLLQCQNSSNLCDAELPWSLTSNTCSDKFPNYGDMIYSRFAPVKKKLLFDHCTCFFKMTDLPSLPPECIIMILEKLGFDDLSDVAEVCETFHRQSCNLKENTGHIQL